MLKVEVMGEDRHIFTVSIDSVLEVPKQGDDIVCGKCGKPTKVMNAGVPYRADNNGQNNGSTTEGQASIFKET